MPKFIPKTKPKPKSALEQIDDMVAACPSTRRFIVACIVERSDKKSDETTGTKYGQFVMHRVLNSRSEWTATHIGTGLNVMVFNNQKDAVRVAVLLGRLGEWLETRSWDINKSQMIQALGIVRAIRGTEIKGPDYQSALDTISQPTGV